MPTVKKSHIPRQIRYSCIPIFAVFGPCIVCNLDSHITWDCLDILLYIKVAMFRVSTRQRAKVDQYVGLAVRVALGDGMWWCSSLPFNLRASSHWLAPCSTPDPYWPPSVPLHSPQRWYLTYVKAEQLQHIIQPNPSSQSCILLSLCFSK